MPVCQSSLRSIRSSVIIRKGARLAARSCAYRPGCWLRLEIAAALPALAWLRERKSQPGGAPAWILSHLPARRVICKGRLKNGRPLSDLNRLEIASRRFSGAPVLLDLIADLLAIGEAPQPGTFDGRYMNENVRSAGGVHPQTESRKIAAVSPQGEETGAWPDGKELLMMTKSWSFSGAWRRAKPSARVADEVGISRQRLYEWRDHLRLHGNLKSRRRGRPAMTAGVDGAAQLCRARSTCRHLRKRH